MGGEYTTGIRCCVRMMSACLDAVPCSLKDDSISTTSGAPGPHATMASAPEPTVPVTSYRAPRASPESFPPRCAHPRPPAPALHYARLHGNAHATLGTNCSTEELHISPATDLPSACARAGAQRIGRPAVRPGGMPTPSSSDGNVSVSPSSLCGTAPDGPRPGGGKSVLSAVGEEPRPRRGHREWPRPRRRHLGDLQLAGCGRDPPRRSVESPCATALK